MSILKKVVNFLFEEEEEIEEEGELEEISFHDVPEPKPRTPKEEEMRAVKPVVKKEEVQTQRVEKVEIPQSKTIVEEQPKEEIKFTNIEIPKQEPVVQHKQTVKKAKANVSRTKTLHTDHAKQGFEFSPVISPIFGASESESNRAKKLNNTVPQIRTTIPVSPKKSPLGTIISPMYGDAERIEENKVKNSSAKDQIVKEETNIQNITTEPLPEPVMVKATLPSDVKRTVSDEEDVVSIPLDDLLGGEDIADKTDEMLQISLFGDDVIVSKEKQEDSYTIKD